ncbi:hypothetical protein FRB97_007580 [Tulasnella sp. 331]|nr:hypothetical protein FRB97_007580 [Tulasnella sp. 331]
MIEASGDDWDALLALINDMKLNITRKDLLNLLGGTGSKAFNVVDTATVRSLGRLLQVMDEFKRLQIKSAVGFEGAIKVDIREGRFIRPAYECVSTTSLITFRTSITGTVGSWDALLDLIENTQIDISREDLAKLFKQVAFNTIDMAIVR